MKGIFSVSWEIVLALIVCAAVLITILLILNFIGIDIFSPICRTFCFPIRDFVTSLMKTIIIGYIASPSSMCNLCG